MLERSKHWIMKNGALPFFSVMLTFFFLLFILLYTQTKQCDAYKAFKDQGFDLALVELKKERFLYFPLKDSLIK